MTTTASTTPAKRLRLPVIILLSLLAVFILVLAVVYYFRNTALLYSANYYARPYGVEFASIQGLNIGSSSLSVQRVQIRQVESDQVHTLHDLRAEYSAAQLRDGELEALTVGEFTLHLPLQANQSTANQTDSNVLDSLLPVLQNFPIRTLQVERLQIPDWLPESTIVLTSSERDLQLQIQSGEYALQTTVNWHDQNYVSTYFLTEEAIIQSELSPHILTGHLQFGNASAAGLTLDLSVTRSQAESSIQTLAVADMDVLSAFLNSHTLLPDKWPELSGELHADIQLRLDKSGTELPFYQVDILPDSNLTLRNLTYLGSSLNTAYAALLLPAPLVLQGRYSSSSDDFLQASAESMELQIFNTEQAGDMRISVSNLHAHCQADFLCTSQQELQAAIPSLLWDTLKLQGVQIAGLFNIQSRTADPAGLSWEISGSEVSLQIPFAGLPTGVSRGTLQVPRFTLQSGSDDLKLQMEFVLLDTASELLPINLRSAIVEGNLVLTDETVHVSGKTHLNGQLAFTFAAQHDPSTNSGDGSFELPGIQFNTLWNRLSDFIAPLPAPVDLLAGQVNGQSTLSWRQSDSGDWQITGPVTLAFTDITGFYEEIGFIGANTNLSLLILEDLALRSTGTQSFVLASVDAGIPVENIEFDYAFDTQAGTFTLQQIGAEIFDGRVQSTGLVFDSNATSNSALLELENIDLERVLSLAAYDAVSATGLISGQLPITLTAGQLTVTQGALLALAPGGVIRYQPADSYQAAGAAGGAVSSGNASLDLVYQALSNYRYQLMETKVDYLEDGELVLQVRLEGINPDMSPGGQPINLNLNISDNIPALLQSLQAGRSIADALEQQLQNQ